MSDTDIQTEESIEEQPAGAVEPDEAGDASEAAAEAPSDEALPLMIEAVLLSVDRPMPAGKLAELTGVKGEGGAKAVHDAVGRLNAVYRETGRSFTCEQVAGGYQLLTDSRFAGLLKQVHKTRSQSKLSPAAMETLAIIAYRQPILRAEVENVRGVASGEVLRSLMERGLVKIAGRAEEIGRPILYGTTRKFLEVFGLTSLKDLPKPEQFGAPPQEQRQEEQEQSETKEDNPAAEG